MLSGQQIQKSLERFLIHIDDDDSPLGEYEWITVGSNNLSPPRGSSSSSSSAPQDVLGSLPRSPSRGVMSTVVGIDNSDADSVVSSATVRSKRRQTVRQSVLGKGSANTGEKSSSSGKFNPMKSSSSASAFTPSSTSALGIGSPPGSPQRSHSSKSSQSPPQILKPIAAVLDNGRDWSFEDSYRNLVTHGLSRLGLSFELAESTDILRKLSWSLLINELGKLLLRSKEVLLEYETQKKEHLAMPQEMLMNIMAMTYQRCATKKFLPYVQHMLPIIEKVLNRPKIGQILRDVMLWEKPSDDPANNTSSSNHNANASDYHFDSYFREKHVPEFRGIIPSKLKRHHEFMCRWFKSLRMFLRCNRQVMNESMKIYTLKVNTINPTSKSMSHLMDALTGSASAKNNNADTVTTAKTPQGLFLLSLIKLLNVNTNRAIKNGTNDVNKDILTRLQSSLNHCAATSRFDDPIRDSEIMRRGNCYAVFHRQLRLAYIQEVEMVQLFRNRKFLKRNNIVYFEEGREKKVITYDRLFQDLQHVQHSMTSASHSHTHSTASSTSSDHQSLIAKMHDFLCGTQELKTASTAIASRSNYAIMITLYMMLVSDVMKHPSNAILNVMLLDLILKGKLQWQEAINFSEGLAKKAGVLSAFSAAMSAAYAVASGSNTIPKVPSVDLGGDGPQQEEEEEEERFVKQAPVDQSHYKILLTMASKTLQIQSKYLNAFFNEISEMAYVYDSILPSGMTSSTINPATSSKNNVNEDPLQQVDPSVELTWNHFQLLVEKECLIMEMWLQSEGIHPSNPLVAINPMDDAKTTAAKQKAALFELMIERIIELCNTWYSVDLTDPKIR